MIVTRARCHQPTRDYLERRRREGKSTREAIRCLKTYLARRVWRLLQPPHPASKIPSLHQFLDIEATEGAVSATPRRGLLPGDSDIEVAVRAAGSAPLVAWNVMKEGLPGAD